MRLLLFVIFSISAVAQQQTFPTPISSSGNATQINGASVPPSVGCAGTNSGSQIVASSNCVTSAAALTNGQIMVGQGSQASATSGGIKAANGILFPTADSTTAIQIDKADGATNIATIDTTNGRFSLIGSSSTTVFQAPISGVNGAYARVLTSDFNIGLYDTQAHALAAGSTGRGFYVDNTYAQWSTTVAFTSLPACASSSLGMRRQINDATVATPGSSAAGGGTFTIAVQCIFNSSGSVYTWIID